MAIKKAVGKTLMPINFLHKFTTLGTAACIALAAAVPSLAAEYVIIVSGLGGEAEFQESFDEQAQQIQAAALSLGLDEGQVQLLQGANASKENILSAITNLNTDSDDLLQLHIIGHGSFDGSEYKFNIPGSDITDGELANALNTESAKQMVAIMTSASGAAMESLQADNRLVITATRTGLQKNVSVFSRFWAEGADRSNADLNKNEIVSIAELYDYTLERVTDYYESENLIASEASLIEGQDNIDADLFSLARIGQLANTSVSGEVEVLLAERTEVEVKLSELSERRQSLTEDEYFGELQNLMLELGLLQQQIDRELEQSGGANE